MSKLRERISKHPKRTFVIIVCAVLLCVGCGVGAYFYYGNNKPQTSPMSEEDAAFEAGRTDDTRRQEQANNYLVQDSMNEFDDLYNTKIQQAHDGKNIEEEVSLRLERASALQTKDLQQYKDQIIEDGVAAFDIDSTPRSATFLCDVYKELGDESNSSKYCKLSQDKINASSKGDQTGE